MPAGGRPGGPRGRRPATPEPGRPGPKVADLWLMPAGHLVYHLDLFLRQRVHANVFGLDAVLVYIPTRPGAVLVRHHHPDLELGGNGDLRPRWRWWLSRGLRRGGSGRFVRGEQSDTDADPGGDQREDGQGGNQATSVHRHSISSDCTTMTQRACTHTDLQGSSRILAPTRPATAIVYGMHEQLAGYISGPVNAEDLVVAPGGEWVLTSGTNRSNRDSGGCTRCASRTAPVARCSRTAPPARWMPKGSPRKAISIRSSSSRTTST